LLLAFVNTHCLQYLMLQLQQMLEQSTQVRSLQQGHV